MSETSKKRRGLLYWLNASEIDEIDNAIDEGQQVYVVARGGCNSAFSTFGEGQTPSIEIYIGHTPNLDYDRRNPDIIAHGNTHERLETSFAAWWTNEERFAATATAND